MAFVIEFLYKNGELVKAFDSELLDKNKIESIMKLKEHDIIPLGKGSEKQNYKVLRINRNAGPARLSGQGDDYIHIDFIVEAIPDKE